MKEDQKNKLLEFLVSEFGGEDTVMLRFHQKRIAEATREKVTLGALLDEAAREGWDEWLRSQDLATFGQLLSGDEQAQPAASGTKKRITKAEKEAVQERILKFLEKHPWSSAREIANAVNVPNLTLRMTELRSTDQVKIDGERQKAKYALKSERKKPPTD